ncbi:12206_t:CDS:2, partial [Dentiscutata heterogama]
RAIAQIDSSLIEGCPLRFKYTRLEQDHAISITDALKMLLSLYKEARLMYFKFGQDCAISLMHLSVMTTVEDIVSLLKLNALNVDIESWIDDTEENLNMLKRN